MKKHIATPLLAVLALVVVLVLGGWLLLNARTTNSDSERIFLSEGTSLSAMTDTLHVRGIISSPLPRMAFRLQSTLLKTTPRKGSYVVPPHTRMLQLVRKLRNGQQDPIRLTIGKFRTPAMLNEYLDSKLMHDDFNITLDSFHLILPDTYEVYWTISPGQFMQRMEKEYNKMSSPYADSATSSILPTFKEVVILASIVEEETNHTPEKPLIASVYLNRLKRGIPLQADPTVKYAVGDFTLQRILNKHLGTESPFNTYLHTGLPPAPICLPSKVTINAVINAPTTDYLYFCASDKMDGTHRFATTLAGHNRNAALFHAALNARGIR